MNRTPDRDTLHRWTLEDAAETYGIRNWSEGYFDIAENGTVTARPGGPDGSATLDLTEIVGIAEQRNLSMPLLARFSGILRSRIKEINESFISTMKEAGYRGGYRGVYPVKVNQKQHVIRDIMRFGRPYHHGLEAGSKAELIAAVAAMSDPEAFLICNGYKDQEFIDLALYAERMGIRTFIVIEMPGELDVVLERARSLGVTARLGVRAKLSSRGGGRWDTSGGDMSKFGLAPSQIIELVDNLRKRGMLEWLQMLHYHIGSQVPDIRRVRTGLEEASRFYAELVSEGAAMGIINIGGGLGVDYDGSHTSSANSTNYSTQEYAADVVEAVMKTMDETGTGHPTIVSESGRATVAHHSVLLFNILDVRRLEAGNLPDETPPGANEMLENLFTARRDLTPRNAQEIYHDALYYRDQIRTGFLHGDVSLRERALAENIFWDIIVRIAGEMRSRKYVPEELAGVAAAMADVYYANFSLFQSLPDLWAIDQLFPIMPIHRLAEKPCRKAVLADITCDSDGEINEFIDLRDVKRVLPLHALNGEEYYLGVFLVGAYQETLGDMHNLLGDVNVLHFDTAEDGKIKCATEVPGDSVKQVLTWVEYDPGEILTTIRELADSLPQSRALKPEEKRKIMKAYEEGLEGYTYFEK
ncbi:MAG: biosynthetic arginine decarboxylase [Kiritimatiellia bacterium]